MPGSRPSLRQMSSYLAAWAASSPLGVRGRSRVAPTPRTSRSWSARAAARRTRCRRRSGGRWPWRRARSECSRPSRLAPPRAAAAAGAAPTGRAMRRMSSTSRQPMRAPSMRSRHLEGGEDVALEVDVAGHVGPGQPSSPGAVAMRRSASGERTTIVAGGVGRTQPGAVVGLEADRQVAPSSDSIRGASGPRLVVGRADRLAGWRSSRLVLVIPRWTCR